MSKEPSSAVSPNCGEPNVQEVERRLGAPLLDRAKRPLELTPAGKLYATSAAM